MKIKDNKELIQSYVLTTAKYDFSIYEKRIIYRLIEIAQADINGKKINNYVIGENLFKDKIIKMPIKAFMTENDKHYIRVKKALLSLVQKVIEYENERYWTAFSIIQAPVIDKYKSFVEFSVNPLMWEAILKISAKGFRKYELKTAMNFNSIYAMRFYELLSDKKEFTYTIDFLKERFKIKDKYKKRPMDFVRKVVIIAKKELDEKAPFSFNYELIKNGKKVTAIKFMPYEIPENKNYDLEEKKLKKQLSTSWYIPKEIKNYLIEKFEFDEKGLRANIKLFEKAVKEINLIDFLPEIYTKASRVKSPQGYLISTLRKYLKNIEQKKQAEKINNLMKQVAHQRSITLLDKENNEK